MLGLVYYVIFGLLPYILLGAAFFVLEGQMLVKSFNLVSFLFVLPFMTFGVGISEEGLFRGYMQTRLSQVYSTRTAILLQAFLFGLWHFIWHVSPLNWLGMLTHVGSTFMVGLLFGYFYGAYSNLTPLVLTHGLVNSVPYGFVESQSAFTTLRNLPLPSQVLLFLFPYALSFAVTFVLTMFLIRAIMRRKESKTTGQNT